MRAKVNYLRELQGQIKRAHKVRLRIKLARFGVVGVGPQRFLVPVVASIQEEIRSGSSTPGVPELLAPPPRDCRAQHLIFTPYPALPFAFESGC
jgi:hypothetical protein